MAERKKERQARKKISASREEAAKVEERQSRKEGGKAEQEKERKIENARKGVKNVKKRGKSGYEWKKKDTKESN